MPGSKRPASLGGWLYLRNDELGATQRVPDTLTDDDLFHFGVRGWLPVDPPEPDPVSTPAPAPDDAGGSGTQWVELVHPVTGGRQLVPNHPDAIAGQLEVGWVEPNKDGSIPKAAQRKAAKDAGATVDDLPAAGSGEDSQQKAGDSTATMKEE